jgi:hypothetical protein
MKLNTMVKCEGALPFYRTALCVGFHLHPFRGIPRRHRQRMLRGPRRRKKCHRFQKNDLYFQQPWDTGTYVVKTLGTILCVPG